MHVLLVSEMAVIGGAEIYLERLAAGLGSAGIDLTVAVRPLPAPGPKGQGGPGITRFVERLAHHADTVVAESLGDLARLVRRVRPALVHWNLTSPFSFGACAWTLLPWDRPQVVTDHLPQLTAGPRWEATRRLANRKLAAIIVVGHNAGADARRHWQRLPMLRVVPNGVPLRPGHTRTWSVGTPLRLIAVGRLEEQKDPLFGLRTLSEVRNRGVDARLRYVGTGSLAPVIAASVAEAGLDGVVELAGFREDCAAEMDHADMLLAPSRWEGLPLAPLEALCGGLPVVASDISAHEEIATVSPGMVLCPLDDVDSWAAAVISTAERLEQLSEVAAESAQTFSVAAMVNDTIAVYEEVLR